LVEPKYERVGEASFYNLFDTFGDYTIFNEGVAIIATEEGTGVNMMNGNVIG